MEPPYLQWTDRFKVGVPILDEDHKAIVDMINEACAAWSARRPLELVKVLESLRKLAAEHFEREEEILKQIRGYTQLSSHAREHRNRIRQLEDVKQRAKASESDLPSVPVPDLLVHWFVWQSIGHDAAIKAYFDDGRA